MAGPHLPSAPAPGASVAPPSHPNAPRRAVLVLAFVAIVFSGGLGGAIGWGLVDTTCSERPTVAQHLLDDLEGYEISMPSCGPKLLAGAIAGSAFAAVGAGVVTVLMVRAQSEWRAHPPGRVRRTGSGGRPRRI